MGLWSKLASLGALAGGGALMATGIGGPLGTMLIGSGLMGAKDQFLDRPQKMAEAERANEANKYSRWSGIQHALPQMPSLGNSVMQGAGAGLAYDAANGAKESASNAAAQGSGYGLGAAQMGNEIKGIGSGLDAEILELGNYSPWSSMIMPNTPFLRIPIGRYKL